MTTFLTILMVLASLILIAAVLLQPSKGGSVTALGGSSQSVFGSTGGTTFLFRVTMWTAAFIMVVSLFLSRQRIQEGRQSVIDTAPVTTPSNPTLPPPGAQIPTPVAPGSSNAPATETPAGSPTVTPQTPALPSTATPSAGTTGGAADAANVKR